MIEVDTAFFCGLDLVAALRAKREERALTFSRSIFLREGTK
jgi:hypothetical protein